MISRSAMTGSRLSVARSSFQPSRAAMKSTDSGRPTCRSLPALCRASNSCTVSPAPIFCWNGIRRTEASWIRQTRTPVTFWHRPVRTVGRKSIR